MVCFPILDRHIEEVVKAARDDEEDILAADERRRNDIWGVGCTKTGRGLEPWDLTWRSTDLSDVLDDALQ